MKKTKSNAGIQPLNQAKKKLQFYAERHNALLTHLMLEENFRIVNINPSCILKLYNKHF